MFNTMENKYQVKAVKTFHGHDGHGWECKLYCDDKRVALVVEDGYGGELNFYWDDEKLPRVECKFRNWKDEIGTRRGTPFEAMLEAHVLEQPQQNSPFADDDEKMHISADIFVSDMVRAFLIAKDVKKHLKRLCFFKKDGNLYNYPTDNAHTRRLIEKNYPDAIILNDMPFEKAVLKYREMTAHL